VRTAIQRSSIQRAKEQGGLIAAGDEKLIEVL